MSIVLTGYRFTVKAISLSLLLIVTVWVLAAWAQEADVKGIPELTQQMQMVQKTTEAMKQAQLNGNKQMMAVAREQNRVAERAMQQSLANIAGVTPADIAGMRNAGLGYGQICQELGMPPGILGLGPKDTGTPARQAVTERERSRDRSREHVEATMRQMNERGAPKHGMAAMSHGSRGLGLGMGTGSHRSSRGFAGMTNDGMSYGGMGSGHAGMSGGYGDMGSGSGGTGGGASGGGGGGR